MTGVFNNPSSFVVEFVPEVIASDSALSEGSAITCGFAVAASVVFSFDPAGGAVSADICNARRTKGGTQTM